jgi:hypothetical protein
MQKLTVIKAVNVTFAFTTTVYRKEQNKKKEIILIVTNILKYSGEDAKIRNKLKALDK